MQADSSYCSISYYHQALHAAYVELLMCMILFGQIISVDLSRRKETVDMPLNI